MPARIRAESVARSGNARCERGRAEGISRHLQLLDNHVDPRLETAEVGLALELPAYGHASTHQRRPQTAYPVGFATRRP